MQVANHTKLNDLSVRYVRYRRAPTTEYSTVSLYNSLPYMYVVAAAWHCYGSQSQTTLPIGAVDDIQHALKSILLENITVNGPKSPSLTRE